MYTKGTTRGLLFLAVYLITTSPGRSQTAIPLPPTLEQLSAWSISYPEWFDRWETAETRCNIDDPTLYTRVRLDYVTDPYLDSKSANKQIEALDKRIVRHLSTGGWSAMILAPSFGIPDLKRCFQKNDSIVQIYKTTGRCTMNSPCRFYDGFALLFFIPVAGNGR